MLYLIFLFQVMNDFAAIRSALAICFQFQQGRDISLKFLFCFSVYIENGRSTAASTFSFNQATGGLWSIKVSQIECSSLSRALPECHQYVTGTAGTLTSYNYPNTQLKNTKFNFCVRTEKGNGC